MERYELCLLQNAESRNNTRSCRERCPPSYCTSTLFGSYRPRVPWVSAISVSPFASLWQWSTITVQLWCRFIWISLHPLCQGLRDVTIHQLKHNGLHVVISIRFFRLLYYNFTCNYQKVSNYQKVRKNGDEDSFAIQKCIAVIAHHYWQHQPL